jgi:tetratricopeptide (TPR) repeat protein
MGTGAIAACQIQGVAFGKNNDRAVQLDPFEGRYWLDVAAATELAGDARGSEAALERALRAEPTSPSIAWDSANFYLAQNNPARSLPLFRVATEYGTKNMEQAAIDLCWRATRSVSQMASLALPPQSDAYLTFLRILINRGESEPANELWRAMIALKLKFSNEQVFPYFDYLIKTNRKTRPRRCGDCSDKPIPSSQRIDDSICCLTADSRANT